MIADVEIAIDNIAKGTRYLPEVMSMVFCWLTRVMAHLKGWKYLWFARI